MAVKLYHGDIVYTPSADAHGASASATAWKTAWKVFGELPAGVLWPTARFPAAAGSGSSDTLARNLRFEALRRSPGRRPRC